MTHKRKHGTNPLENESQRERTITLLSVKRTLVVGLVAPGKIEENKTIAGKAQFR